MGADSTLVISRHAALQKIFEQMGSASNDQLANVLYDLWGEEHLYNFKVLNTPSEPDDEKIKEY